MYAASWLFHVFHEHTARAGVREAPARPDRVLERLVSPTTTGGCQAPSRKTVHGAPGPRRQGGEMLCDHGLDVEGGGTMPLWSRDAIYLAVFSCRYVRSE